MSTDTTERDRVWRDSRHCQTCSGSGLATVYRPEWTGRRTDAITTGEVNEDGEFVKVMTALEVSAHCVCSLGQWMRSRLDDAVRRRIPDVLAIVEGTSRWSLEPPLPGDILPFTPREAVQRARSGA